MMPSRSRKRRLRNLDGVRSRGSDFSKNSLRSSLRNPDRRAQDRPHTPAGIRTRRSAANDGCDQSAAPATGRRAIDQATNLRSGAASSRWAPDQGRRTSAGLSSSRFPDLHHLHLTLFATTGPRPRSRDGVLATLLPDKWTSRNSSFTKKKTPSRRAQIVPQAQADQRASSADQHFGAPGRSRTRNLVGRNHLLYPVELRRQAHPPSPDGPRVPTLPG